MKFSNLNIVFKTSAVVLILFSLAVFAETQKTYEIIETISLWVRDWFGSFYLYLGAFCVLFIISLAISPLGKTRLGLKNTPEYPFWTWIAMLYSTGMGAGILLRAVQEPAYMFANPPLQLGTSNETLALEFTFYQWGLTAWAFYGLFAIIIGYFVFNKQQKLLTSAAISQTLKKKTVSNGIDILAVLTTVFGLVAAIALGATQITQGFAHINDITLGLTATIGTLTIISVVAFISVWRGIDRGIKQLSRLNIIATLVILGFVISQNNGFSLLSAFGESLWHYIADFIPLSLAYGNYNPGKAFLTEWTYYYWAFWISWAPFTGVFIARISRGRTLRELLIGVLLIPSFGTFVWFTAFGNTTFDIINQWDVYNNEFSNVFSSIFVFFEHLPFSNFLNIAVILLLISFLVTSLDSAIFVLSIFTSNGNLNPSKFKRFVWSVILFIFCIAILLLGNAFKEIDVLIALQKILIITSLPFAILLIVITALFLRQLLKRN